MDSKGKSMNTSVPSIAIRFHTNDEELEQLYVSDSEIEKESNTPLSETADDPVKDDQHKAKKEFSPKRESSPMKDVFTKLSKRSSSVDSNIALGEHSPCGSGDRWRLFSEIKGKLTKTVEEKISEIKSGSKQSSDHEKEDADTIRSKFHASKENSSVSDSEDVSISESSTSKFADVEMSSTNGTEDETEGQSNRANSTNDTICNDLDDQLFNDEIIIKMPRLENVRHRFKKCSTSTNFNVQYKTKESTPPVNRDSFIETATEALEEDDDTQHKPVPQLIAEQKFKSQIPKWFYLCSIVVLCSIVFSLMALPNYLTGFLTGLLILIITQSFQSSDQNQKFQNFIKQKIEILNREQLSIKTYEPSVECEGWMNEYPGKYDVNSYHIGATHSVFVRLKGSKLVLSSGNGIRVPKRAMWNEAAMPHWKLIQFNHHRVFDMKEAKVKLLPEGLARKRYWSKKYPICLEFKKMPKVLAKLASEDEKLIEENVDSQITRSPKKTVDSEKITTDNTNELVEELEVKSTPGDSLEVDSNATSRKPSVDDNDLDISDDVDENSIEWDTIEDVLDDIIHIYLFTRTDRDKEEWFNHFVKATQCDIQESIDLEQVKETSSHLEDNQSSKSSPSHKSVKNDENKKKPINYALEYQNFMKKMQVRKKSDDTAPEQTINEISSKVLWLNSVLGRILLDAIRQEYWVDVLQQRIQRKLSVIKLPYFIEELMISELNLGTSIPMIHKVSEPIFDSRGVWVDFDITYEGSLHGTLETKLNLMKLKKPPVILAQEADGEKIAENTLPGPVYDSDLDDSAESSSEEDLSLPLNWISNPSSTPTQSSSPNSSSNTTGKKILKMVDKIAASKYFQQATDYKLIKKAMEGVSRTELKLRVELKGLVGVLTINIPPPPTHRIWIGFRGNPQLWLNAKPIVGERSLNINQITSWIENKLQQEFQKILVLPNMEDFVIPIMNQNLPE